MYRILVGDQVVYDSTDKLKYPVTEPTLSGEWGQAGSLEFTVSPDPEHDKNKTLINRLKNVRTFVTAEQDGEEIFFGRVLDYEEDMFGALRVTCEGALTFLLDSDMEEGNFNETVVAFFRRCIAAHNAFVGAGDPRRLEVGSIVLDMRLYPTIKKRKESFKVKGSNNVSQTISSLITQKYGGYLEVVKDQNGTHRINYIQRGTRSNPSPIEIGNNVISQDTKLTGDKVFTVLRPLGKNNLTIEKADTGSLIRNKTWTTGKKLVKSGGEEQVVNTAWKYYDAYIPVTQGNTYMFGPGEAKLTLYSTRVVDGETEYICQRMVSFGKDPDTGIAPNNYTIPSDVTDINDEPVTITHVRISMQGMHTSKAIFKLEESADNKIDYDHIVSEKIISVAYGNTEEIDDATGWCYCENYIDVSAGEKYVAVPAGFIVACYTYDQQSDTRKFKKLEKGKTNLGGDIYTIPSGINQIRLSFPSVYGETFRFEEVNDNSNLIAGGTWKNGKYLDYRLSELEEEDAEWNYVKDYIAAEEYSPYTAGYILDITDADYVEGGLCKARLSCYDKNKRLIAILDSSEKEEEDDGTVVIDTGNNEDPGVVVVGPGEEEPEEDEEQPSHIFYAPEDTKYIRLACSTDPETLSKIKLQRGEILIGAKFNKKDKTIEIPDRIAQFGKIIRTETFGDITDANRLYLAAIEFINRNVANPPLEVTINLVEYYYLNPTASSRLLIGDIVQINGIDEKLWVASMTKNMENPAEDEITLKNASSLADSGSGGSSGNLSSAYASSQSYESTKYKYIQETLGSEGSELKLGGGDLQKLLLSSERDIEAISTQLRFVSTSGLEDLEQRIDFLVKDSGAIYSQLSMTKAGIYSKVQDEKGEIYSEIEQTASMIRMKVAQLEGDFEKLSSEIKLTAEQLQLVFKDMWDKESARLRSEIDVTAEHLTAKFEEYAEGATEPDYIGEMEMTARRLWRHYVDRPGEMESVLELTAEHLQLSFDKAIEEIGKQFHSELELTAQHLRLAFEEYATGGEEPDYLGEMEVTARRFWLHYVDKPGLMESVLELTAEHLQLTFDRTIEEIGRQFHSELELTAQHLTAKFEEYAMGGEGPDYLGELEMTARRFWLHYLDRPGGMESVLELTAEHLQLAFDKAIEEIGSQFRSELELTAQHLKASFEEYVTGGEEPDYIGEMEMTARKFWQHFYNRPKKLESTLELTAEHLQLAFADALKDIKSRIEVTANYVSSIVGDIMEVEEGISAIQGSALWQEQDGLSALVGQLYVTTDSQQRKTLHIKEGAGVVVDRDTAYGTTSTSIGIYALDKMTAGLIVEKLSAGGGTTAKISADYIDMSGATFNLNASETIVTAAGKIMTYDVWRKTVAGTVDSPALDSSYNRSLYQQYIRDNAAVIVLEAATPDNLMKRINISADEIKLSADHIDLDGDTIATRLTAANLNVGAIDATRVITSGNIMCGGYVTDHQIVLSSHYHDFSASESGGVVSLTLGGPSASPPGTKTFNMASTSWYRNIIVGAMLGNNLSAVTTPASVAYNSETGTVPVQVRLTFPTGNSNSNTRNITVTGIPSSKTPSKIEKRSSDGVYFSAPNMLLTGTGTLTYSDNTTFDGTVAFYVDASKAYNAGASSFSQSIASFNSLVANAITFDPSNKWLSGKGSVTYAQGSGLSPTTNVSFNVNGTPAYEAGVADATKTPSSFTKTTPVSTTFTESTGLLTGTGKLSYVEGDSVNVGFSIRADMAYNQGINKGYSLNSVDDITLSGNSFAYNNGTITFSATATCAKIVSGSTTYQGTPKTKQFTVGVTNIPAARTAYSVSAINWSPTVSGNYILQGNSVVTYTNNTTEPNIPCMVNAKAAYDKGWNDAIDAATAVWARTGGTQKQLYDSEYDTYVLALVSYGSLEKYYNLPAKKT